MNIFSLSDARSALPRLIKSVHEEFERVTITVNGASKVILIAPEEIEAYEETIATLSDQDAVQALIHAEKDWKSGNVFSHEDVFNV